MDAWAVASPCAYYPSAGPCPQDMDKLEPGAFYLDRSPQSKHLMLAGTRYKPEAVDRLWERLGAMAAPALPPVAA